MSTCRHQNSNPMQDLDHALFPLPMQCRNAMYVQVQLWASLYIVVNLSLSLSLLSNPLETQEREEVFLFRSQIINNAHQRNGSQQQPAPPSNDDVNRR